MASLPGATDLAALHSTTAALRSAAETLPKLAQVRQGQIPGQLPATEPDRRVAVPCPEGNRVADHCLFPPGLEAGSDKGPAPPQTADELGFVFGGDRCLPHHAGEGDPWGLSPLLSGGASSVRLCSARASLLPSRPSITVKP